MRHLGDITKIKGNEVPIVDVVTGGSPCQDLSVAGKRAGLDGERSGLFMEQIRIVKEMREEYVRQLELKGADYDRRDIKPRFMVWENVPGAFSSNKGEDFRCVLEETARVADKDANVPGLTEKQRWSPAGCIMGDGWSIAWRVHDAQFWGVPQRRKRIALVADFGGESAPKILFEPDGLPRNTEESGEEREGTPSDSERDVDPTISFQERGGKPGGARESSSNESGQEPCQHLTTNPSWQKNNDAVAFREDSITSPINKSNPKNGNPCHTLSTDERNYVVYGIGSYDSNSMKSPNPHSGIYEADTTRTLDLNGGNPACNQGGMIVLEGNGQRESHKGDGYKESNTMYTLNTVEQHGVCYGLDRASFNQGENAKFDFSVQEEKAQTIVSRGPGGVMTTPSEPYVPEITKE